MINRFLSPFFEMRPANVTPEEDFADEMSFLANLMRRLLFALV